MSCALVRVLNAMQFSKSVNDLTKLLEKNSISLSLRYNEEGRLYGVTFVDRVQEIAINGSRLHELFSANNIEEWIRHNGTKKQYTVEARSDTLYKRSLSRVRKLVYAELKNQSSNASKAKEYLESQGVILVRLKERQHYYYDTWNGIIINPDDVNRKYSFDDFDQWQSRINELNYLHSQRNSNLALDVVEELLSDEFDRSVIDASKDTALHNKFKRQMKQKRR